MDLSQETEDYIRESIEHSLGLPVSTQTLQLKLKASEKSLIRLRNQYLSLQAKWKEKDETIERTRAESSMNASALKKFVEENQRLAVECSNLLTQCKRWEKECVLYDHDREALMDFVNEADERAKEAEIRVHDLKEEVRKSSEELNFYKCQYEAQMDDTATDDALVEQNLLDNLLETVIDRDDAASTAHAFLEANSGIEVCQRLLTKWKRLRPSTQKAIALVAEVNTLQKDKEHLMVNLHKAEDEVNVLFEQNNVLDVTNKRLIRLYQKEKLMPGSGGKPSSGKCSQSNKRKSSPKISSPVEGKLDFIEIGSSRQPLSPLRENSPEYRLCKKIIEMAKLPRSRNWEFFCVLVFEENGQAAGGRRGKRIKALVLKGVKDIRIILVQRGSTGSSSSSSNQNRLSVSLPGSSASSSTSSQPQASSTSQVPSALKDDELVGESLESIALDEFSVGSFNNKGDGEDSSVENFGCDRSLPEDEIINIEKISDGAFVCRDSVKGLSGLEVEVDKNEGTSVSGAKGSSCPPPPPKPASLSPSPRRFSFGSPNAVRIGSSREFVGQTNVSTRTSPTRSRPSSPRSRCQSEGYNSADEQKPNFRSSRYDVEREHQFEIDIRRAKGLEVKRTWEDGNCLFRAVADQVYGDFEAYDLVRQMCIDYMVYGNVEIQALSEMYNCPIHICSYSIIIIMEIITTPLLIFADYQLVLGLGLAVCEGKTLTRIMKGCN